MAQAPKPAQRPKRGKPQRATPQTRMGRLRASNVDISSSFYQERRRDIIAAAAQIFRDHGFAASNFGMIADHLGADRATIYYYFGSKHELFQEVVREVAQHSVTTAEQIAAGPGNAPEKLRAAFQALLETYATSYPYMHVFLQENLAGKVDENDWRVEGQEWAGRYYQAIHRIIEQGVAEGTFASVLPVGLMTLGALGTANWAYRWFRPGGKLSASEIGDGFATMLIDGIGQQPVTVGKSGNKGAAGRATRQPNAEGAGTKGAGTKGAGTKGAGTKRADTGKSTAAGSKTAATTLIPGAVPRKPRT